MKNIFLVALTSFIIISCNSKGKKDKNLETEEIVMFEEEVDEDITKSNDINSFEEQLNNVAIGGKGIVFENGGMSFDINSLKKIAKQTKEKLNDIKTKHTYESEDLRQNAIQSMELNLNMFQGIFCCTTHNGKHCEDSNNLKKLESKYDCNRFMKKK